MILKIIKTFINQIQTFVYKYIIFYLKILRYSIIIFTKFTKTNEIYRLHKLLNLKI